MNIKYLSVFQNREFVGMDGKFFEGSIPVPNDELEALYYLNPPPKGSTESDELKRLIRLMFIRYPSVKGYIFDIHQYLTIHEVNEVDRREILRLIPSVAQWFLHSPHREKFKDKKTEIIELVETYKPAPLRIDKNEGKRLTLRQIAIWYFYSNRTISKKNADEIARSYGHTSGAKLYQHYIKVYDYTHLEDISKGKANEIIKNLEVVRKLPGVDEESINEAIGYLKTHCKKL
jgi:hypothetical protein